MAEATERWSDRTLTKSATGWTAHRAFDVIEATSESDACDASGVPVQNAQHPDSSLLKVSQISAPREGYNYYIVRIQYSTPPDGSEHGGITQTADPLTQPIRYRWSMPLRSEQFDRDIDENPIVNSAGDPFTSPPTRNKKTIGLTILRNEPFYSVQTAFSYANKVSSANWVISGVGSVPEGCAYCAQILPTSDYAADASYVTVGYQFEMETGTDPFQLHILDQGVRAWYAFQSSDYKGTMFSEHGDKITTDILLAGDGTPIDGSILVGGQTGGFTPTSQSTPAGATIEVAPGGAAYFLKYRRYFTADFNGLNF